MTYLLHACSSQTPIKIFPGATESTIQQFNSVKIYEDSAEIRIPSRKLVVDLEAIGSTTCSYPEQKESTWSRILDNLKNIHNFSYYLLFFCIYVSYMFILFNVSMSVDWMFFAIKLNYL